MTEDKHEGLAVFSQANLEYGFGPLRPENDKKNNCIKHGRRECVRRFDLSGLTLECLSIYTCIHITQYETLLGL